MKVRTIRRAGSLLAAALLAGWMYLPARADLVSDPDALYAQMKKAYDQGSRNGWHYNDQMAYLSSILDAGRAYSLRRPEDPNAAEIHNLTVDYATSLHYDPLINEDAAEWYVREAATAALKGGDPARAANAQILINKLDAADADVHALGVQADVDGTALAAQFPGDRFAQLGQVQDDLRAFELTHDTRFRSLALQRAAEASFPLANLSNPYSNDLNAIASSAIAGVAGYSAADTANAKQLRAHRAAIKELPLLGRVDAMTHDARLVITAPADEYFGQTKLSPLGVRNEITRINKYLDAGWGTRMTGDAVYLADSIEDWQHQYPRDYAIAQVLLESYQTIERISSSQAHKAAEHLRSILLVQYFQTTQAQSLLSS